MRAITLAALSLCIALGSCAKLETVYSAATTSTVPAKSIYVAENAFNVAKKLADSYVVYCTPNPTPAGCNDTVIADDIIPAIDKGTKARNTLAAFLAAHPGELGDKGVYDALTTATATLNTLIATNDKRS